jgi:hypothetical protein
MKTLFRNKKLMTGVITVMVGITILLAGIAFAWFFGASGNFDEEFEAGDMGAVAKFDLKDKVLNRPILPGDKELGVGELSVPAGVKMHLENPMIVMLDVSASKVIAKDGTALPTDVINFIIDEDGVDGEAWPLGMWIDVGDPVDLSTAKIYTWMKGNGDKDIYDNKIYVEMMGGDTLHYGFEIEADGMMDNRYLGAKITLGNGVRWIQSRHAEDALLETRVDTVHAIDRAVPSTYFPKWAEYVVVHHDDPDFNPMDFFTFFPSYIDVRRPQNNWIGDPSVKPNPPINGPVMFSGIDINALYEIVPEGSLTKAYLAQFIG